MKDRYELVHILGDACLKALSPKMVALLKQLPDDQIRVFTDSFIYGFRRSTGGQAEMDKVAEKLAESMGICLPLTQGLDT